MKVVYAKALSVPEKMRPYFKEGNTYQAHGDSDGSFFTWADNGTPLVQWWFSHRDDTVTWQRLEYPYRDPKAVEDVIAALQSVAKECRYYRNTHLTATQLMEMLLTQVEAPLARLSPAALGGE